MNSESEFNPFYAWVPKWLGISLIMLMFFPILSLSGVYTANTTLMASELGIINEHITFANFCTNVGMVAFGPFLYRIMRYRRQKFMCMFGFLIMAILSLVCGRTENVFILGSCCIILGFLRMLLMLCNLFTLIAYAGGVEACEKLQPGLEPKTDKDWDTTDMSRAFANIIIYWFFMLMGQCGTALTAKLADNGNWQDVYYIFMAFCLLCMILMELTMPWNGYGSGLKKTVKQYLTWIWRYTGPVTTLCLCLGCFSYVMVYGKTLDWFDDASICWATAGIFIFGILLLVMDYRVKRHAYFALDVFKQRNVLIVVTIYALLMCLNCSAMFVSLFTSVGMSIDSLQAANLNNWTMVGYSIGAIFCVLLCIKKVRLKACICGGFLFMAIGAMFMYFEVQPQGLYERMPYAVILRSIGMMMPYCILPVLATQRMPFRVFSSWIALMLCFRMVIGPSIGTAIYGVAVQERTQHYITRFAQNVDPMNLDATVSYQQISYGMRYQGKSYTEAEQMASISTKGSIQKQAMLTVTKDIAGKTIWACLIITGMIIILPLKKTKLEYIVTK